jgi:glycosyltransferase involved in cell wall biosynthesis
MTVPAGGSPVAGRPTSIDVIIPACNEQDAIGRVIGDIPRDLVRGVYVVDNGSTDATAGEAARAGARVVAEPRRGYGWACLAGMAALASPDIVVFLDGDYSDFPEEMRDLLGPILSGRADLVIGSRTRGRVGPGALLPQARFGNWLATRLIRAFYGVRYSDLGPFRAIRHDALLALNMQDKTFGWTVEMQVRAAMQGLRATEVPVSYRRRIGVSKVTGTLSGTLRAGWKILYTLFRLRIAGH